MGFCVLAPERRRGSRRERRELGRRLERPTAEGSRHAGAAERESEFKNLQKKGVSVQIQKMRAGLCRRNLIVFGNAARDGADAENKDASSIRSEPCRHTGGAIRQAPLLSNYLQPLTGY